MDVSFRIARTVAEGKLDAIEEITDEISVAPSSTFQRRSFKPLATKEEMEEVYYSQVDRERSFTELTERLQGINDAFCKKWKEKCDMEV